MLECRDDAAAPSAARWPGRLEFASAYLASAQGMPHRLVLPNLAGLRVCRGGPERTEPVV
jgi:hypothetical protein